MRRLLVGLCILCCSVTSSIAQVSIGIGFPGVSIGINLPVYPQFVQVPGYPVYYAPRLSANFFFYDGLYWVYEGDNWYASSWYNGPWSLVDPWYVPVFVLRIPVRYYRAPPPYFRGWRPDAPPRWGEHWGNDWERHRSGWDQWNRHSVPAPAPLPVYQRQYSGERYPHQVEQQQALHRQNYRYQPRDPVVRQHYQEQAPQRAPASPQRGQQGNAPAQYPNQRPPGGAAAHDPTPSQMAPEPKTPPGQDQRKQPQPAEPRPQQPSGAQQQGHPQDKAAQQDRQPKDDKGKDHEGGDEQGQEHKK
jgi:hypothetical protein